MCRRAAALDKMIFNIVDGISLSVPEVYSKEFKIFLFCFDLFSKIYKLLSFPLMVKKISSGLLGNSFGKFLLKQKMKEVFVSIAFRCRIYLRSNF